MNTSRFKRTVLLSRRSHMVLALVVSSGNLVAQSTTGNIRGYVTVPVAHRCPNAQVVVRMPATNETRGTTTNASGFYYLAGLRPGSYIVTVRRVGVRHRRALVDSESGRHSISTSQPPRSRRHWRL